VGDLTETVFRAANFGGNQMTIGELRDELDDWPESFEIIFGCPDLEFYRLKKRTGDLLSVGIQSDHLQRF
jgi:hypothetical protein